jgi:hypothetical protein
MSNDPYKSPMAGGNVEPHRGTMILVLGILSIVCCQPIGIAALLMANSDLKKMQAGQMDRSGESTTNVGKILGIIGCVLLVLNIIFMIVWFGVLGAAAAGGAMNQ